MPKASTIQTAFTSGEVSPLLYGRVDSPRYKTGMASCLNYVPMLQGPLVRRPGTKYMNNVKDSTKPPILIPFTFSGTQAYILEFGDKYIRFYANNGQIVTTATTYQLTGFDASTGIYYYTAVRPTSGLMSGEGAPATIGSITSGDPLELQTPYAYSDLSLLRWAQNADTLYLSHPSYPLYKLQRYAQDSWALRQVYLQDGPYLALNSYATTGDSINTTLKYSTDTGSYTLVTGPSYSVGGTANNGSGLIRITTTTAHTYVNGQKVYISGVTGTTEANNSGTPGDAGSYWVISVVDTTHFDLIGSTYTNAFVSGGTVFPALFTQYDGKRTGSVQNYSRLVAFQISGVRYWGTIYNVTCMAQAVFSLYPTGTAPTNNTVCTAWQLGVYYETNGYPSVCCFHQNRLVLAAPSNYPEQIDGSQTGLYEGFAPSDPSNLTISDSNAYQFQLNSQDVNAIRWLRSSASGLLAGTYSAEWAITPSSQQQAITPTNVNAQQTSFFGSAQVDAVQSGEAALYVQRAQRKLREMMFFWQMYTFKSTDLTELSEHITLPTITKLALQKETQPICWAVRSDGLLLSMIYKRELMDLQAAWSRNQLGGQSDTAGTNPIVQSIAVIPSTDLSFDQLWLTVKRWINGAAVITIEYMTKIFDDSMLQEDAFQFDCGATYDSPKTITAITNASPAVVTAAGHGFSNGDTVKITSVNGLNKSTTDVDGNTTISNLVNETTFVIANVTTDTFELNDFSGNAIDSSSYGVYVSGGEVRKLVSTISGLTWLKGETVGVLADGSPHPDVTVNSSGQITLSFPAAKVQIGYRFNSDGQLLRPEAGSADGTSIGKIRRIARVAAMLHRVGDLQMGMSFDRLIPVDFSQADQQEADEATPLWSGIHRDGVESAYDFDGQVCFRQNSGLPGMINSITQILEEFDV